MNKSSRAFLLLLSSAVVLTAGVWASAQSKSAESKPFKPLQPLAQMMNGQKSLMDDIKNAIGEKNWDEGRNKAWLLAEIANVNHYQRDDAAFQKFADQMAQQCSDLAKLLTKREDAAAKAQVNKIGATCNACHDQFKKD